MANTNGTQSWAAKWFQTNLQETLKVALVAEAICNVDRSGSFYIWNPYAGAPATTIQSLSGGSQGTYTPATYTSVNDALAVTDEFVVSEHIYDFEIAMQHGNIKMSRMDEMVASVATAIDKWVLNNLCEDATGTYDTPVGGFTSSANVNKIFADLISVPSGYIGLSQNYFIVIENTDEPGITLAGATSGFNYADRVLNNGKIGSHMGVDIYVKPSGTFVSATIGSTTVTNAGHRVFGVKGLATYASPVGISFTEKGVTGKTGFEMVAVAYSGFKLWYQRASMIVDITIK